MVSGNNLIEDCFTCDVAWIYKDAHKFGLDAYKNLVGHGNLRCMNSNGEPILESENSELISFLESCPCKSNLIHNVLLLYNLFFYDFR